ncbi:MAG TPA: tRNA (adenosine(37)-N6)-threonylcarbamoyltransferase complex ATPase subunit type 1 TsaE [Eudoraea sp.]|nr:tRNA (adenosine(37)-N6)-threonylcarbamoyltransferase complex ATPase subunit type 1 TsaE [Eudoraea sp.]
MEFRFSEAQLPGIAQKIIASCPAKILCLFGEMGSGKTTLIKALVKALGGGEGANSPTFGLVNEYHTVDGALLAYHFDFYRIEDESEALDLGLEDYLSQDVWIFMEWPEKVASLLPGDRVELYIRVVDKMTREVKIDSFRAHKITGFAG